MKKLYYAALSYLVLGLASGVFYREFTKHQGFPQGEYTQLSTLHTHLLVLGFVVMLLVLVLEKLFRLSQHALFTGFFWVYNAGLVVTAAMMVTHGVLAVGGSHSTPATQGIAGLGHIMLAVGLVFLMIALGSAVSAETRAAGSTPKGAAAIDSKADRA